MTLTDLDPSACNNARQWDCSERKIKKVECLDKRIAIPAINELRYAGYHLVQFLKDNDRNGSLEKAKNHCKRAIYDASECGIVYCLERIDQFKDDYRLVEVAPVIPLYIGEFYWLRIRSLNNS